MSFSDENADFSGQSDHTISTAVNLPIDIIHHLIESIDVYGGDFPADEKDRRSLLAACSLVCRAWNDISRHVMFRKISFKQKFFLISRLCFFRDKARHLTKYVKEADISFENDFNLNVPRIHGWLSECFDRFENLVVLHLVNYNHDYCICYGEAYNGILHLLTITHLREFHLHHWVFQNPDSLLRLLGCTSSTTLESLSLKNIQMLTRGSTTVAPPHLEALHNLEVYDYTDIFFGPGRVVVCPNLKTCSLNDWPFPPWIPTSKLSKLTLCDVTPSCAIPIFQRAICPFELAINMTVNHGQRDYSTWISNCLKNIPAPDHLRQLSLHISFRISAAYPLHSLDYEPLSRVLHRFYQHCNMERVQINIELDLCATTDWSYSAFDRAGEVAKLGEAFEPLMKESVLYIDFSVRGYCPRRGQGTFMRCRV
ncbi:F-box domain-containing protein [Pleurotus pulmonarius]